MFFPGGAPLYASEHCKQERPLGASGLVPGSSLSPRDMYFINFSLLRKSAGPVVPKGMEMIAVTEETP